MEKSGVNLFEAFLNQHGSSTWSEIVSSLIPSIHKVDRSATEIWFHFYPLDLAQALQMSADKVQLARDLALRGKYELKDQIDSSHRFLYGHRFWPEVKKALVTYAESTKAPENTELSIQIRSVARDVAQKAKADESLLIGITAVAFMTLQQVGLAAFKLAPGQVHISSRLNWSPEQVMKHRAQDDSQGPFGFLRGAKTTYTVTFDENDNQAKFTLINTQHLTTASANDKRDYVSKDDRCMSGEGPIPIECRSAACGTCWVGILGGAEKLSEVGPREGMKIKEFGYIDSDEPRPVIRLACMAQASGAVSIVIPPWNGVFGKHLRGERSMLEDAGATTNR